MGTARDFVGLIPFQTTMSLCDCTHTQAHIVLSHASFITFFKRYTQIRRNKMKWQRDILDITASRDHP